MGEIGRRVRRFQRRKIDKGFQFACPVFLGTLIGFLVGRALLGHPSLLNQLIESFLRRFM